MATVPATHWFNSGDLVTATDMNVLRDNFNFINGQPTCKVGSTVDITLTAGTYKLLNFDAEYEDTDAMHDTVTNNYRVIAKTAGVYECTLKVHHLENLAAFTSGNALFEGRIAFNNAGSAANMGTNTLWAEVRCCSGTMTFTEPMAYTVTDYVTMAVNDYVEAWAYATGVSAPVIKLQNGEKGTTLALKRVSA